MQPLWRSPGGARVPQRTPRGQGCSSAPRAADDRSAGGASARESADGARSLARPARRLPLVPTKEAILLPHAEPCREGFCQAASSGRLGTLSGPPGGDRGGTPSLRNAGYPSFVPAPTKVAPKCATQCAPKCEPWFAHFRATLGATFGSHQIDRMHSDCGHFPPSPDADTNPCHSSRAGCRPRPPNHGENHLEAGVDTQRWKTLQITAPGGAEIPSTKHWQGRAHRAVRAQMVEEGIAGGAKFTESI